MNNDKVEGRGAQLFSPVNEGGGDYLRWGPYLREGLNRGFTVEVSERKVQLYIRYL